ncbi:oxalate decarboxylase [Pluteus cervinus]|uniref:Oxalate decarboxylase n=1 Tax=Pluteus cervinus TaxID=181527 RepID=A0ACD3B5Q4_9AGAR|nr:oxalate decarboxylase [Pluteus cervinus]
MIRVSSLLCSLLLASASLVAAAPAGTPVVFSVDASTSVRPTPTHQTISTVTGKPTGTSSAYDPLATVPKIDLDPNGPLWSDSENITPEPVRGKLGAPMQGPHNSAVELQNPDLLAAPSTDHGSVPNVKWPFALSHNRLQTGGWARQQNINAMPIASAMAGVNMRLEPGAVRELHWHKTAEWAYVLKGKTQITAVDAQGRNYVDTVGPGDLWFFPPGIPHSLQATDDDPEGSEFVLVFDDGHFSEDSTFLLTDWLAHVPAEVIAKNFEKDITKFDHLPSEELFIFPAANLPGPDSDAPKSPQGTVPDPYSFKLSQVPATKVAGGSVRIADSSTFKVSKTIAVAEVTVDPGAIRELHWHPSQDEWSFFLEGHARVTVFASQSNARTFDYQAGDIGYVPATMGHYVENIGNSTLKFLEIFNSDRFEDISLNQWLALTPPDLVKSHLGFSDEIIDGLHKTKPIILAN